MANKQKDWISAKVDVDLKRDFTEAAKALGMDRSKLLTAVMEDVVEEFRRGGIRKQKLVKSINIKK